MKKLTGDVFQIPPMVSAAKIDGVPLYKRARKGQVVERQPKLIHVYEFRMTGFDSPRATFLVRCSKGTYARTLCADIGDALGCGAHLEQLRRTRCGEFDIDAAMDLKDLISLEREELVGRIIPLSEIVARTDKGRAAQG